MIGNKGYEGKNFKDSLRYEMPKITMADLADEFLENLKAREKKKIKKKYRERTRRIKNICYAEQEKYP